MARNLSGGLSEILKSGDSESYLTLRLTLRAARQSEAHPQPAAAAMLHLATADLLIDGVAYEPYLKEIGAMKLSLDGADDYVEVRLQNAGKLIGVDLATAMEALRGARARYGRYQRDLKSGRQIHKTLLNGLVTSVQSDGQNLMLTLASESYFSQAITPVGAVAPQNRQNIQTTVQTSSVTFDPSTFRVTSQPANEGARVAPRSMPTGVLHVVYDFDAPTGGLEDATVQIQAAIDEATSSPFKAVYIPPGRFRVTQLVLKNDVTVIGAGSYRTVIESVSDKPIITVETEAYRSAIQGVLIKGDVTKPKQVGINLAGTGYYYNCFVEDVVIESCGSHGLYINEAYSSAFEKIRVTDCAGYPFLIDTPNRPNIVLRDCYVSGLRPSAPVAYRIKAGQQVRLENCNGVDNIMPNTKWAMIGRKEGLDGDSKNESAYVQLVNCNIESWTAVGVECLSNSVATFESSYFAGDATANGAKKPIRYEVDSSLFAAFFAKGTIDDKTTFADGPASNYANGAAIHSNDLPPLMLSGQGAGVAADQPLSQYYDTTTKRKEFLTRADAFHKRAVVTASTSFGRPGVRLIEVSHSEPVTITLPWPGWYRVNEPIIVIDAEGVAATHPITINANSGGTVNGAGSYQLNKSKQAVMLLPNDSALDWRVVADFAPGSASPVTSGTKFIATTGRGSRSLDWSTALTRQHTLTGDTTFSFSNAIAGQLYTLILVQDATGGREVLWPSAVKWPGGAAGQPTPNAHAKDVFQFVFTGSQWLNVSQAYDLS